MIRILLVIIFLSLRSLQAELFFTPEMIATHLKGYSEEEIRLLKKDLAVVRSICLEETENANSRFYLATAGGPGARKTTILEKFVFHHPEFQNGVYLDPDARALKFMAHTYYAKSLNHRVIAETNNFDQVLKNGYEKWRGGSNYIALTLLEEAFDSGRSIIHGTTSTGGHIPKFFEKLKNTNYKIVLLLCSCSDEVRRESVDYRNRITHFYQSTPEDAVTKGLLFPQKLETYFALADQLYFYWSDSQFSEKLAAVWSEGNLEIHDMDAFKQFAAKYEQDRQTLKAKGTTILSFDELLNVNTSY